MGWKPAPKLIKSILSVTVVLFSITGGFISYQFSRSPPTFSRRLATDTFLSVEILWIISGIIFVCSGIFIAYNIFTANFDKNINK